MTLKDKVDRRLKELDRGPTVAEKAGGLSKGFISDIIKGKKRSVTIEHWPKLAIALDMTDEEIVSFLSDTTKQPRNQSRHATSAPASEAVATDLPRINPYDLPKDVPVRGMAAGSVVGAWSIDGIVDMVRRPPGLSHAPNAYALYVAGTSMSPKYEPGDLIYINPDRPAGPGDVVVIQTQMYDGATIQAWIKTLVTETGDSVVAHQLNPPSTVTYGRETVVSIQRVMRTNELFGV